ncbi:MAG: M23 family metallopeptidase [Chitinophagaceae bacterium]|nr:MAG: M23 family metallopeptidase [Chitinophagaceae bacterium]
MKIFLSLLALAVFPAALFASTSPPASMVAKALIFPIAGKASIGSYWGDERDAGARKHEGIDIFAARGTPVVAVADGYVLQVANDGIGGKSVTIQSDDYTWRSYYAHLDAQHVQMGQLVKKGMQIGTVGNTGNAKTTSPHLHFGIYDSSGALDPLPYVKTSPKISTPLPSGEIVYRKTKSDQPVIAKSSPKRKGKFPPEIKTAAINILTGIFTRKVRTL